MRFAWYATMVATLAVAMGCEGNISTTTPGTEMSAAPAPPEPMPPGDPAQAAATAEAETADEGASAPAAEVAGEPAAEPAAQVAEVPADEPADSAADGDAEVATAESGAKGRDYQPGLITTPIQEYFRAEGRINLRHMANALRIYKAGHDNKGPQTHEEFMEVIVKENGVDLPELPSGDEYLYDPKTEQLLVKHPSE